MYHVILEVYHLLLSTTSPHNAKQEMLVFESRTCEQRRCDLPVLNHITTPHPTLCGLTPPLHPQQRTRRPAPPPNDQQEHACTQREAKRAALSYSAPPRSRASEPDASATAACGQSPGAAPPSLRSLELIVQARYHCRGPKLEHIRWFATTPVTLRLLPAPPCRGR